jgi:DNA-binding response OmpR family regulator
MGGEELAFGLKTERHDLRVVFMSGYTSDATALQAAVAAGDSFVAKPFTPSELARQVRAALDRPREESWPPPVPRG